VPTPSYEPSAEILRLGCTDMAGVHLDLVAALGFEAIKF